jgi:hypothetical protein
MVSSIPLNSSRTLSTQSAFHNLLRESAIPFILVRFTSTFGRMTARHSRTMDWRPSVLKTEYFPRISTRRFFRVGDFLLECLYLFSEFWSFAHTMELGEVVEAFGSRFGLREALGFFGFFGGFPDGSFQSFHLRFEFFERMVYAFDFRVKNQSP